MKIPVDAKYNSETIQQIAWEALRKHRTQGMDKLDYTKIPIIFKQPAYHLFEATKNTHMTRMSSTIVVKWLRSSESRSAESST